MVPIPFPSGNRSGRLFRGRGRIPPFAPLGSLVRWIVYIPFLGLVLAFVVAGGLGFIRGLQDRKIGEVVPGVTRDIYALYTLAEVHRNQTGSYEGFGKPSSPVFRETENLRQAIDEHWRKSKEGQEPRDGRASRILVGGGGICIDGVIPTGRSTVRTFCGTGGAEPGFVESAPPYVVSYFTSCSLSPWGEGGVNQTPVCMGAMSAPFVRPLWLVPFHPGFTAGKALAGYLWGVLR